MVEPRRDEGGVNPSTAAPARRQSAAKETVDAEEKVGQSLVPPVRAADGGRTGKEHRPDGSRHRPLPAASGRSEYRPRSKPKSADRHRTRWADKAVAGVGSGVFCARRKGVK